MNEFSKSELVFLSKLDLDVELTAIQDVDENGKRYWYLHVKAINNGFSQEGIHYGFRKEIRRFYQLNALFDVCQEIFGEKCKYLKVKLININSH